MSEHKGAPALACAASFIIRIEVVKVCHAVQSYGEPWKNEEGILLYSILHVKGKKKSLNDDLLSLQVLDFGSCMDFGKEVRGG